MNISLVLQRRERVRQPAARSPNRGKRKEGRFWCPAFKPDESSIRLRGERLPEPHGRSHCPLRRRGCDRTFQRGFEPDGIHPRANQTNTDPEWLLRKWANFRCAHPRSRRCRRHHHQYDGQAKGRNLLGAGESRGLDGARSFRRYAGDVSKGIRRHQTAHKPARAGPEREARAQDNSTIGVALRREKTSVSQEDYLKAIWEMLEEDHTPISARLAEELKVTPPALTAALKPMTHA